MSKNKNKKTQQNKKIPSENKVKGNTKNADKSDITEPKEDKTRIKEHKAVIGTYRLTIVIVFFTIITAVLTYMLFIKESKHEDAGSLKLVQDSLIKRIKFDNAKSPFKILILPFIEKGNPGTPGAFSEPATVEFIKRLENLNKKDTLNYEIKYDPRLKFTQYFNLGSYLIS